MSDLPTTDAVSPTLAISSGARALALAVLVGGGIAAGPGFAAGVALAPHRAVYELSLDEVDGAGITSLAGRIVFESAGSACEGYTETMRFVTRAQGRDGKDMITDLQSSTFEKGPMFDFVQRTLVNGQSLEDVRGRANRSDAGARIDLTRPEDKSVTLAVPVVFPNEHMRTVIEAAQKGEHFLKVDVFDGSDGADISPVTTVIGAPVNRVDESAGDDDETVATIPSRTAWPVVFSYFDANEAITETAPSYQMSGLLYDNGVMRKLRFDYGDYSVRGSLSELEFFQPADCGGSK